MPYRARGLGWLSGLSLIFFILSLLLSFGLFFYRSYLEGQIKTLANNLQKVEKEFEPGLIIELQKTVKTINSTGDLLNKHVALSRLFDFLEENTISDARFFNFSYDKSGVQMSGTARSYAALAQQSLVFEQSRLIKNVSFSNFNLASDGFVNFNVKFTAEPELIFYQASTN